MQKIKYIIIFTLVLALAMVCKQLIDYERITTSLLKNNTQSRTQTDEVQNKVSVLELQNEELQNKIISLEEKLSLLQIEHQNKKFSLDNNRTKDFPINIQPLNNDTNETTPNSNLMPNITIDDENEITGFGLEYTQKF